MNSSTNEPQEIKKSEIEILYKLRVGHTSIFLNIRSKEIASENNMIIFAVSKRYESYVKDKNAMLEHGSKYGMPIKTLINFENNACFIYKGPKIIDAINYLISIPWTETGDYASVKSIARMAECNLENVSELFRLDYKIVDNSLLWFHHDTVPFECDITRIKRELIEYQIRCEYLIERISPEGIDFYVRSIFKEIQQSILHCQFNTQGGKAFLDSKDDPSLTQEKSVSTSARCIFDYLTDKLLKTLGFIDYMQAHNYIWDTIGHKMEPTKLPFFDLRERDRKAIELYKTILRILSRGELFHRLVSKELYEVIDQNSILHRDLINIVLDYSCDLATPNLKV